MKCKNKECNTYANYGYIFKKPLFCAKHRNEDMIDVNNKICENENCNKRAFYGIESTPIHCIEHKEQNEFNVVKGFCKEKGCKKKPTFGLVNKKPLYCIEHKKEDMYNVMKIICKGENCNIQPTFGTEWNKPLFCKNHKTDGLINVVSKRCIRQGCDLQPVFGYEWKKPIMCFKHKKEDMTNINNKICENNNCKTSASFGETWMKPLRCHKHKLNTDKNVTHKSCKSEFCETIGNPKYKGYCLRCFIYTFPNEKISRQFKIKEQHIVDYIKQTFNKEKIIVDKIVDGGCSKRRPDVLIDKYTHSIIIECDENQHSQKFYDKNCENKRIMELFQDLGSRPLIVIRFNPDEYVDQYGIKQKSCFSKHKGLDVPILNEKEFNKRMEKLNEIILESIYSSPIKEITIHELFYNQVN